MTKTPEELTADWKEGKLDWNKFYYIKLISGEICIDYANGAYFVNGKPQEITMDYTTDEDVKQILAPVLSYDEYKAIQEELAEHRHYCCCMENEVMRLDKAKLEEEIESLRQKNKMWAELAENLLYLEEGNWENLVKNGTKEQRLDFLKRKEKYSLLAILDKYEKLKKELESARWYQTAQNEDIGKLRGLLKECLPIVSAEIMTWQIRGGEESHKRGQDLLTRINAALGESEER